MGRGEGGGVHHKMCEKLFLGRWELFFVSCYPLTNTSLDVYLISMLKVMKEVLNKSSNATQKMSTIALVEAGLI